MSCQKYLAHGPVITKKVRKQKSMLSRIGLISSLILDYSTLLRYFENNKIDLALCDYFMIACVDAATTFGIPYIVTCALDPSKGISVITKIQAI